MATRWKAVRLVAGAVGLTMVAVAMVSALRGEPGRIELLVLILGVAVVAASVLGRRTPAAYRSLAIIGLNSVILFIVLEVGAGVLLGMTSHEEEPPTAEPGTGPEQSPFYDDQDWTSRYLAELRAMPGTGWYHPHELWRRAPFQGELVNVSREGLRLTPGAECGAGALVVYTFGGSAMWGLGVPDWGTIPAYLQSLWSGGMSRPVCVRNFGQLGHTSTQGVIALLRELQRCSVPDLVIFHDGVNDVNYGRIYGIPGAHRSLFEITRTLEEPVATPTWADNLSMVQLARNLLRKDAPRPPHRYQPHPDEVAPDLAEGIFEVYLNNVRMVEALAGEYGFAAAFFWQPHIAMGKKPLTEAEQRVVAGDEGKGGPVGPDGLRAAHRLHREVYAAVARAAESNARLHDLSSAFDSVSSLVYLDSHHLTPDGNRLVAERMADVLGDRISGARAAAEPQRLLCSR